MNADQPDPADVLLRVDRLSIAFRGLVALDEVSLEVSRGRITAVIGPNGAGKTTMFNCISGLYDGSGSIRLAGQEMTGLRPHQRAGLGLSRTFQTPALVEDASVLSNVMLGAFGRARRGLLSCAVRSPGARAEERRAREEAGQVLDELGLLALATTPVATLPHGQRRRVEIARAVLSQPRLLMLDEPAAGINAVEAQEFGHQVSALATARDITLLLVEHNVSLVMSLAAQVVVLNLGRVIAAGSPASVREDPAVVGAYLGHAAA